MLLSDLFRTHPAPRGPEKKWPGKEETASKPISFLFLSGVARQELQLSDCLDLPNLVIQNEMREFMGLVTSSPTLRMKRVEDDYTHTISNPEGPRRESPRLKIVQLLQSPPINEFVCGDQSHIDEPS